MVYLCVDNSFAGLLKVLRWRSEKYRESVIEWLSFNFSISVLDNLPPFELYRKRNNNNKLEGLMLCIDYLKEDDLVQTLGRLKNAKDVCIVYSSDKASMYLNYLYLVPQLSKIGIHVYATDAKAIYKKEIDNEKIHDEEVEAMFDAAYEVSQEEIDFCQKTWNALVAEPKQYRIMEKGKLKVISQEFVEKKILAKLPDEPVLGGHVLCLLLPWSRFNSIVIEYCLSMMVINGALEITGFNSNSQFEYIVSAWLKRK